MLQMYFSFLFKNKKKYSFYEYTNMFEKEDNRKEVENTQEAVTVAYQTRLVSRSSSEL